jgi:hypothetical protein
MMEEKSRYDLARDDAREPSPSLVGVGPKQRFGNRSSVVRAGRLFGISKTRSSDVNVTFSLHLALPRGPIDAARAFSAWSWKTPALSGLKLIKLPE